MTIVLTNDDGIDALGLAALFQAVKMVAPSMGFMTLGQHSSTIITVAPVEEMSGCGHQVTTRQPIAVHRRSDVAYAIGGTPADCTRLALSHLCPDVKLVIAGINAGGNLGADIYISGTIAAVREAALHQIPAIAISHYRQGRREIDWELATRLTQHVLTQLLARPLSPKTFWNVNLPHLQPGDPMPAIVDCPLCRQPLPVSYYQDEQGFHYNGKYGDRQRDPGADVEVCLSGQISVTQLCI
ncbi:MAG: 5'/3'-nucleotidase SurE [Cyanobacteria bacterium]|nr:5'/3'-nucleotidase SurE [Cyanobacteriota bacterium]MDW8201063.1 5'/3'-nucleotidase SurE [Cyanobacteriota bacterium SKYGB_h_bin112]